MGKTALLEHAVERAHGMLVLRARGVESEAEIPFAGLHALLRPAFDRLEALPEPQSAALRAALGLAPGAGGERFLIGAATLSLLAALAEERPVLVAVDDAHWLDESSFGALLFAARRLFADAVAIVIATRSPASDLPTLALEGLDREAAAAVLSRHAGGPLPPGAADRLFEATLGNPLALVELAATAAEPPAGPLTPVETSIEHTFAPRIGALPEPTRRLLALAAAEDSGDLAVLECAAAALGLDFAELAAAERARLVTVSGAQLLFGHPLARSAAYRSASSDERRAAHRALAAAGDDPDRRAWHRARAVLGHDGNAATELEHAAARARERGGYTAAASAFERAARLTSSRPDRARRLFCAAEATWLAGHTDRAAQRLAEARAECEDPALLGAIDHLRGHAALRSGRVQDAYDILVEAAENAPPAEAVVLLAEASEASFYAARPESMLRTAQASWAALPAQPGERERVCGGLALGMALIYTGAGEPGAQRLREATTLLEHSDALSGDPRLLYAAAMGPLWLREAERGRALVARAIASARATGAVGALPSALWLAARDAATSDRLAVAVALYEEAIRLARETGQATALCGGLAGLACVEALQGAEAACREHATEALDRTGQLGLGFFRLWALDAIATLELGLGDVASAIEWLTEKERMLDERGIADPDVSPVPELVEAFVRLDRDPGPRLEAFAANAEAKGQPWSLARLARCRGVLTGADEHFAAARRLHAHTPDRFEEARTELAHGETLRRARRRADAREPLRRAVEGFDALGAKPWAERARRELEASGETARRRDPLTLDQLTPRELQVALVLADGHTIREAATKLFLSPKTVDYHLRHVYRKLAIASRAALAEALAEIPGAPPDAKAPEPDIASRA
jgi:DNA-binding CsgD family transcriptional regulator